MAAKLRDLPTVHEITVTCTRTASYLGDLSTLTDLNYTIYEGRDISVGPMKKGGGFLIPIIRRLQITPHLDALSSLQVFYIAASTGGHKTVTHYIRAFNINDPIWQREFQDVWQMGIAAGEHSTADEITDGFNEDNLYIPILNKNYTYIIKEVSQSIGAVGARVEGMLPFSGTIDVEFTLDWKWVSALEFALLKTRQ